MRIVGTLLTIALMAVLVVVMMRTYMKSATPPAPPAVERAPLSPELEARAAEFRAKGSGEDRRPEAQQLLPCLLPGFSKEAVQALLGPPTEVRGGVWNYDLGENSVLSIAFDPRNGVLMLATMH